MPSFVLVQGNPNSPIPGKTVSGHGAERAFCILAIMICNMTKKLLRTRITSTVTTTFNPRYGVT